MNDELKIKNNELGGKMNYRYRTDDEMKDSGVEWIGKIPKKWSRVRVGHLCEIGRGRVISSEEIMDNTGLYPVYSSQTKDNGVMGYINTYDFQGEYVTWTTDGANAGTVFKRNGKFNCTNVCGTLKNRSKELDLSFLAYALSIETKPYVRLDINPKLMNNEMSNIKVCITKNYEQRKIAKFLDEKTAQFDSIISKKEALIEKLEEAKKSLISEVVTGKVRVVKTNDGYELVERKKEEMKDSGVEWLGNIPKEWSTTKLKLKTSQINRGKSPEYVDNSNIKVINQACIYWDEFKFQNVKYQDESIKSERGKLYKNDILINSTGTGTLGRANIFYEEGEYIVDSHVTIIRCLDEEYSRYINKVLRTDLYQGLIYSTMVTGSTNQIELSREGLRNMIVLDLSKEELININNLLEVKINDINSTIIKSHLQIEKLKEAKLSLISEAVTGKIEILD